MMETVYCGVDFHARTQVIAYCDSANGEIRLAQLDHRKDDVRGFYSQFTGQVIVGLESGGYSSWFEAMLEELGHTVWTGHATEIRRRANWRQKNDRRDAELILEIMLRGDFALVHRHSRESVEVLRMLRYRARLIKMRTMICNNLQAIAMSCGLTERSRILSRAAQERLKAADDTSDQATVRRPAEATGPDERTDRESGQVVEATGFDRGAGQAVDDSPWGWRADGSWSSSHPGAVQSIQQSAIGGRLCGPRANGTIER